MNGEGGPSAARTAHQTAAKRSTHRVAQTTDSGRVGTLEALSRLLRDEGIARANANCDEWWANCFDAAVGYLASTGVPFTADDVRDLIPASDQPNRVGARFYAACRAGLIQPVGFTLSRSRSRHAGVLRTWVGVR